MADADLSRIVNLIMENPKLIEEIKALASSADASRAEDESEQPNESEPIALQADAPVDAFAHDGRRRRNELLCALKPFLSEKRGRAIDSMMSIADILEVVKSR